MSRCLATILLFSFLTLVLTEVINTNDIYNPDIKNLYPLNKSAQESLWVKPFKNVTLAEVENNECYIEIPPYWDPNCGDMGGYPSTSPVASGTVRFSGVSLSASASLSSSDNAQASPSAPPYEYVEYLPREGFIAVDEASKIHIADAKYNQAEIRDKEDNS